MYLKSGQAKMLFGKSDKKDSELKSTRKNSSIIICSSAISKMGDILFDYANKSFLSNMNSNSLFFVGVYQILESMVGALFNLFGGVIADQFNRKRIIILSDFCCGGMCIFLSFFKINSILLYGVIVINVFLAILSSFSSPAYKSFIKDAIDEENIAMVNSYSQSVNTIVKISTPLFSIPLYKMLGINGTLFFNGCSFLLSGFIMLFVLPISFSYKEKIEKTNILYNLKEAYDYLDKRKEVFNLIVFASLINFFLSAYSLILPYGNLMFTDIKGNIYGSFLTAEAVGGLLGSLISGRINKKLNVFVMISIAGISGISLGFIPIIYMVKKNIVLLSIGPLIYSIMSSIFNIQFLTFIQTRIVNDYLGRVFGLIYSFALLLVPVGTSVFTIILTPNNMYNLLFIGLGMLILSIVYFIFFKMNKFDSAE